MAVENYKEMLGIMYSADHFSKEVFCTMNELVEALSTAGDAAFTILFNKKPNEDSVVTQLQAVSEATL
jgi:hypothetical protein